MGTPAETATFGIAIPEPHALAFADMDGDGKPDILSASKLGAFVFLNRLH